MVGTLALDRRLSSRLLSRRICLLFSSETNEALANLEMVLEVVLSSCRVVGSPRTGWHRRLRSLEMGHPVPRLGEDWIRIMRISEN